LAALAAAVFVKGAFASDNLRDTWPPKVIYGLAIAACVSAAFGISLGSSARFFLEVYLKTLVFALLLIAATRNVRDLRLFVWAYVLSVGILSYFSISVFRLGSFTSSHTLRLSNLYTYDANDVGLVMVVGIPLTLLTLETSGRRGKIVCSLILLGMGVSLARGGSRGAFLGLLSVGLLLLLVARHISLAKRMAVLAALVVALGVAAPPGYWRQMQTMTRPTEDYNWQVKSGRIAIWSRGLGYMKQRPVFGLGVGNFSRAEGTMSELARSAEPGVGVRWFAPHNSFLQAGAEMGLPGLLLFSTLVIGVIVMPPRLRRRMPRYWLRSGPNQRFAYLACTYLPVAMVGFAVCGFFLSFAYMDLVYLLAAFAAGLEISARQMFAHASNQAIRTRKTTFRTAQANAGAVHTSRYDERKAPSRSARAFNRRTRRQRLG
jgi:O-antigen ligase